MSLADMNAGAGYGITSGILEENQERPERWYCRIP